MELREFAYIKRNIEIVKENIARAAVDSGRKAEDIMLVAAAKTYSCEMVKTAIGAGVDAIGENRVQEMTEKHGQGAYTEAPLHFIGTLQSNKVGKVVGVCDLIESVDSIALLSRIGKKAISLGIVQNCLLEINIGKEPQKAGILPEDIFQVLESAADIDGINVLGLMTIGPIDGKNSKIRHFFDKMFQLYIDISAKKYDNVSVRFLSMGMSDSYIDAIHAGANIVRVGSAIFGNREL